MRGTFIVFKPNRKGGLDVRTMEGKRGEIIKRRGKFNAGAHTRRFNRGAAGYYRVCGA